MMRRMVSRGMSIVLTREYFSQFLFFAIPIGVAAAIMIVLFYHQDVQTVEQGLRDSAHRELRLRAANVRQRMEAAVADLKALAAVLDAGNRPRPAGPAGDSPLARNPIVCRQHTRYRRVRTVTDAGRLLDEVVCDDSGPARRPAEQLPGDPDRALAAVLTGTWPDRIHISGIVEAPPSDRPGADARSVIELGALLQNCTPDSRCYVVVDADLNRIFLDRTASTGPGVTVLAVHDNGRTVGESMQDSQAGQIVVRKIATDFRTLRPQAWAEVFRTGQGEVETADGRFTFRKVEFGDLTYGPADPAGPSPRAPSPQDGWWLASFVAQTEIAARRNAFLWKSALLTPAPLLVAFYLAHVAVRRRRAAHDLEESERYLRHLINSVVDGIVTTDQSGQIERANSATLTLFGYESFDALPKNLAQLVPLDRLDDRSELACLWRRGEGAKDRTASAQLSVRRRDGGEIPAELSLIEADLGGKRQFIWIIRDIRERQAFAAKENAVRMRFFHQTKMAEIGLIAAGIIHEVGNPVAAIAGTVSQVLEETEASHAALSPQSRESLKMISHQAERLAGITREISDFVRTRPGVIDLFDLNSLVRSTVRLVRYDPRWKDIRLSLELDPGIPAILGIEDQIAQVLMNLLVNAGDAVQWRDPDGRKVTVHTENHDDHVLLLVADNGHGMSEEAKSRAFESFFTTKPEGKGTGLGLYLCNTIITAHQGVIKIHSAEGAGATIRIQLPVPALAAGMPG